MRSGRDSDITVSCGIRSPFPVTGIGLRLEGQRSRGRWVELTFDGEPPRRYPIRDGAITSDTTDMAMAYLDAVTHMRHGSSVRVRFEEGREARFPLTDADHAIADCQPDVERLSSEPRPVSSLGR